MWRRLQDYGSIALELGASGKARCMHGTDFIASWLQGLMMPFGHGAFCYLLVVLALCGAGKQAGGVGEWVAGRRRSRRGGRHLSLLAPCRCLIESPTIRCCTYVFAAV
jgi:hypothetical protein